jgi:L-asparaginase
MRIKFITTGGTIDKVYFDAKSEYEVGPPQVLEILQDAQVTFEYEVEPVLAKDSLDMTEDDRRLVRERVAASTCNRLVVTHGTDTLIATARSLEGIPEKTIVLTGAMQPARFRDTDAAFNLGCAVAAVQALPPGVYVAMNGRLFDPKRVYKNIDKDCFEELAT